MYRQHIEIFVHDERSAGITTALTCRRNKKHNLMAIIEIHDVTNAASAGDGHCRFAIDLPKSRSESGTHVIRFAGWVIGCRTPVRSVEVLHKDRVLCRAAVCLDRPDVAKDFPNVADAHRSGFDMAVALLGISLTFELVLRAILADNKSATLATIRGQRQALNTGFQPQLRPLLLTSMGRTGTTYLMRLLAEHPNIVAYRQYPYETRHARYWLHMTNVLSSPPNGLELSDPNTFYENMSHVGISPYYTPDVSSHPQLENWFGRCYPEQLAAFCQKCIEESYLRIAEEQNQAQPRFFVEKHSPGRLRELTLELYPKAAEIVLVRDFRDMVCSILAFNARRGYQAFGRENANTDEEFIRSLCRNAKDLLRSWEWSSPSTYLLRYEDLITCPAKTIGSVFTHLDLDGSSSTVAAVLETGTASSSDFRKHQTSKDPATSIGRWQHDLTIDQQSLCQDVFGEILKAFGYDI